MAIRIYTHEPPHRLLQRIKFLIDQGQIDDWSYDSAGDFTHSAEHLRNKAWFRAEVREGTLRLTLIGSKSAQVSRSVYSAYHGDFIQTLFMQLNEMFTSVLCWTEEASLLVSRIDHHGPPARPTDS